MTNERQQSCDVAVIGAGMAGMAAALFAAERGLSCIQVGNGGGLLFASGLLDLLGVHPVAARRRWRLPGEALAALAHDEPEHPLARIDAGVDPQRVRDVRRGPRLGGAALRPAGRVEPGSADVDRHAQDDVRRAAIDGGRRRGAGIAAAVPAGGLPRAAGVQRPPDRGDAGRLAGRDCATSGSSSRGATARPSSTPPTSPAHSNPGRRASGRSRSCNRCWATHRRSVFRRCWASRTLPRFTPRSRQHWGYPCSRFPPCRHRCPGCGCSRRWRRPWPTAESIVATGPAYARWHSTPMATTATLDLASDSGSVAGRGERVVARAVVLATGRFSGRGLIADRGGARESILGLPVTPARLARGVAPARLPGPVGSRDQSRRTRRRRRLAAAGRRRKTGVAAALRRRIDSRAPGLDALQVRFGIGDRDGVGGGQPGGERPPRPRQRLGRRCPRRSSRWHSTRRWRCAPQASCGARRRGSGSASAPTSAMSRRSAERPPRCAERFRRSSVAACWTCWAHSSSTRCCCAGCSRPRSCAGSPTSSSWSDSRCCC